MSYPSTYYEWFNLLENYEQGNDSALAELANGTFAIDAGTVYRFYNKVNEVYSERKKRWLYKFNRMFQVHYIKNENDISIILQNAKVNLQPIAKFISLNAFPDDLKTTLYKDFEDFVFDVRKNLKESIMKNELRSEKMLLFINTFKFYETSIEEDFSSGSKLNSSPELNPSKKRILF